MITLLQVADGPQGQQTTTTLRTYTLPHDTATTSALVAALMAELPAGGIFTPPPPVQDMDILTWVRHGALRASAPPFPPEDLTDDWLHAVGTAENGAPPLWQALQDSSLIQFHILPETQDAAPEQSVRPAFTALEDGGFRILASGFPEDDPEENPEATLTITDGAPLALRSRTRLLHAALPRGEGAAYQTTPGRALFVLVVEGATHIGETPVRAREAALITGEENLTVIASAPSVILLVDSPLAPRSLL
jgi:redox-sensitive bicupin YhaK (pirin superfamily)